MGDKNPFQSFIDNLESMNSIPNRDYPEEYAETLINKYGLTISDESKELFIEYLRLLATVKMFQVKGDVAQCLYLLLWDLVNNCPQPLTAVFQAFVWGYFFREFATLEEA